MSTHRLLLSFFSMLVIITMLFSGVSLPAASAQGPDGVERQLNPQTGKLSFISPPDGQQSLPAADVLGDSRPPQDPAMALAKRYGPEFGLKDPGRDLQEFASDRAEDGRLTVRYQQNYQGVPVIGGELIVNTNDNGDLYSLNGEVSSNLSLSTEPAIASETAKQTALQAVAKWYQKSVQDFVASEPELWIYDESLLQPSKLPAELVWRMEVTPKDASMPVRELVLVNARQGGISLHFNQIDTAWETTHSPALGNNSVLERSGGSSPALVFSPIVSTYTANHGSTLPGSLVCTQASPTCAGGDAHAQAAHKYAIGTFNLYATQHNRNSINGAGMKIISTVRYRSGYANAFWTGAQMVYGDAYGFPLADDVVAHELTHGVTQYESNLFYYYQSGAINESFSDLWGEYYDQTNGKGNDDLSVKWLMGEDVSGWGAIRSMSDPTWFGDPDTMSSYYYYEDEGDNGGVHSNSGINNKAVYLMVDGGYFNGKTVIALGWTKTAAIYYEANTKLLASGADYSDLYYALQKACSNLVGQKGITAADCAEVKNAVDAVEMNGQPAPNFNTDAPLCAPGSVPNMVFTDDLENGTGKWAFANGAYPRWQLDSLYGPYAQSGNHSLYADDYPATITDATARLASITIPPNAFLHFAHAYGFEGAYSNHFDGGVLEYSTNGGSSWTDAGSLINFNGYKGQVFTGAGNPLSGRSAFVGSSHGYISTRLNLSSLAGRSVSFRWRMGLDVSVYNWGWWVDNVKVYTCIPVPGAFNKTAPSNGGTDVGLSTTLSWNSSPYATSYQYCYDVINDNKCNRTWLTTTLTSVPISSLGGGSTYYWQVRALNKVATTEADNKSWGSFTTTATLPAGTADLETYIRGTLQGKYSLGSGLSLRESYTGVNNGPVMIRSANGIPMMAAERMIYKSNGVDASFSEMMALPASQLDTIYWLPWYNNKDIDTQLRIANVSNTDATVQVTIGGQPVVGSPFLLGPGASIRKSFPGIDRGPVKIESDVPVVASERVIYKVNGADVSYSEMMALPASQLDTTYWLPWYNNKDIDTQLRFANVSDTEASVSVTIGGQPVDGSPFLLGPGASIRRSFPGIDRGPVKIESTVNIIASERVIYKVNGVPTSFSELMALPNSQLDMSYWLPWYNNKDASMDTQLRFANVSDTTASVQVFIRGVEVDGSPFTLVPGQSTRKSFPGIDKGPVQIVSTVPIVASERVIYKVNGVATSFSELMGLPEALLDVTYWLPWYNNVDLNTQLRFGVP